MKKKSLLILPVLLLALASCNKEDDVVPEDDDTPVVQPSGDEDTDEDEKEELPPVVIDERIKVAEDVATLEDTNVEPSTASYRNLSDFSITSVTEDEKSGDITYVLGGTANAMNDGQAGVYWNNVAAIGDAYFVLTIELEEGETVTWQAPDHEKSKEYAEMERTGEEDLILRISGDQCYPASAEQGASQVTFTISDGTDSVKHIVDFSNVVIVDARVTLTTGSVSFDGSNVPFTNDESLYISSMTVDASGNVTYYLAGTPDVMSACQEEAFQVSGAAGSAYVVLTVSLEENETVSFNGKTQSATTDVIVRLVNYTNLVFTITTTSPDSSVTHTVDFSGVTHPETQQDA